MRIAYIPMYSSPHNILTCSTYNHVKLFVRSMVEARPECFVYVTVPEGASDLSQVRKELDHPRIVLIPVPAYKNQHKDLVWMPSEVVKRFAEMDGDLYVDAVITDKPTSLPWLKSALHTWSENGTGGIKVIYLDRFSLREREHTYMMDDFFIAQTAGLASADMIVWATQNVFDDALATAKKFLSFSLLKQLRDKSRFLYSSLDTALVESFAVDRDPKDPQRIVNYAYGLTSGYKWDENLEVFDYLFARGNRDIKVLVTTSSAGAGVLPERYTKYMDVHTGLPQAEFWRTIAKAHAFIHLPNYVQLSQSVIEQQLLGLVGVFPDKGWVRETVYKGYPYIGKGMGELNGMLRYVIDNYFSPEVQDVIAKQKAFLRERFDGKVLAVKFYDEVEKLVGKGYPGSQGGLVADCKDMFSHLAIGDRITYDQWADVIKEKTRMHYDVRAMPLVLHGFAKNRWRKAMENAGFRDTCDTIYPGWERVA